MRGGGVRTIPALWNHDPYACSDLIVSGDFGKRLIRGVWGRKKQGKGENPNRRGKAEEEERKRKGRGRGGNLHVFSKYRLLFGKLWITPSHDQMPVRNLSPPGQ